MTITHLGAGPRIGAWQTLATAAALNATVTTRPIAIDNGTNLSFILTITRVAATAVQVKVQVSADGTNWAYVPAVDATSVAPTFLMRPMVMSYDPTSETVVTGFVPTNSSFARLVITSTAGGASDLVTAVARVSAL